MFIIEKIYHNGEPSSSVLSSEIKNCRLDGKILRTTFDNKNLIWHGDYECPIKNVEGSLCISIKLNLSQPENEYFSSEFPAKELKSIKNYFDTILSSFQVVNLQSFKLNFVTDFFKEYGFINSSNIASTNSNDVLTCNFCSVRIRRVKMRCHVAGHLFNKDLNSHPHLCGFCGQIKSNCKVELIKSSGFGKNKTISSFSKCSFYYDFSLGSAGKMTKNDPCTNRPVVCGHCSNKSIFWSYNLKSHYDIDHPALTCPIEITAEEKNRVLEKLKPTTKTKKK